MAGQKQVKAKVPAAGSLAAPLRGGYSVQPGSPDGPEYFAPTLDGQCAAISRAGWLAVGGPGQQVLVHRAGREPKVFYAFADGGACTLRPACVIPAQRPAAVRS